MITHETKIEKDASGKKLVVTRAFHGSVDKVWSAWTESNLLDQWWAPKPYKTQTKTMECKPGGRWLYTMISPEGEKHWCKVDYEAIDPGKSFSCTDGFCDEHGNASDSLPPMHWLVQFSDEGDITTVTVDITFNSEEDLEKIIALGFKEGFTAALGNLDEMLATQ